MADNNILCQKNALKRGRKCSLKGTVNFTETLLHVLTHSVGFYVQLSNYFAFGKWHASISQCLIMHSLQF